MRISDEELLKELGDRIVKTYKIRSIPKQDDLYFPRVYTNECGNRIIEFADYEG